MIWILVVGGKAFTELKKEIKSGGRVKTKGNKMTNDTSILLFSALAKTIKALFHHGWCGQDVLGLNVCT